MHSCCRHTILPNPPSAIKSTAATPKRVASMRSKGEGQLSRRKIISIRLGHPDDLHALHKEPEGDLLGPIPADTDDRINSELASVGDDFSRDVSDHFLAILHSLVMEGIAAVGSA